MSYRTVYKYPLPAPVSQIEAQAGGVVRLVGADPATGNPAVWIEHDLTGKLERRTFLVIGTGMMVEPGVKYHGSMIADQFVWHVYERASGPAA